MELFRKRGEKSNLRWNMVIRCRKAEGYCRQEEFPGLDRFEGVLGNQERYYNLELHHNMEENCIEEVSLVTSYTWESTQYPSSFRYLHKE